MNKIAIGLVVAVTLAGLAVAVGLHLASRGTGAHCHSATIAASGPPFHNVCDMSARIERFFNREADLARSEAADRKPGEPAATPLAPLAPPAACLSLRTRSAAPRPTGPPPPA